MMNPQQVAQAIAYRTAGAWAESFSGHEIGVPLGAVAALTLLQPSGDDADQLAKHLLEIDDMEVADLLSRVWCFFTILRPELAMRVGPFGQWLDEEPRNGSKVSGAAAVVRIAAKSGIFGLTTKRPVGVDVLGYVHQELAGARSKQAQGQFYTPGSVAELMAQISVAGVEPGQSICDPTAGTGGLLRAAAETIRAEGRNPHEVWWYACDIDPVAVAGLAVNFHTWDLGPRVIVGCANSLAEPNWEKRARDEQLEATEANGHRLRLAHLLAATKPLFDDGPPETDESRRAA